MPLSDINRRNFIKSGVALTISTGAVGNGLWFQSLLASVNNDEIVSVFTHGVASGEPQQHSVLLWTRVNPQNVNETNKVHWEISTEPLFKSVIKSGYAEATRERDYTLKVVVDDLSPGTTYFYRFLCRNQYSEMGRTKTLPAGKLASVTLAVASCSNYAFGFFNAYKDIALDDTIDYVLHLGDYIYEYGQDGWGSDVAKSLGRQHNPTHETVSLQDYRLRHAQYKRDKASRIMHAAHPIIPTWDDHESTNNPYMQGAQNHQEETEGAWLTRRDASLKAYFEWMPVYDPKHNENPGAMWRRFDFGDLATMVTLETRHTGRSKQINYQEHLTTLDSPKSLKSFKDKVLNDPTRNMLSPKLEAYYIESFSASLKNNRPWRLVANQIPMARTHVPKTDDFIGVPNEEANDPLIEERKALSILSKLNLPIYTDTWDGYPQARERFYKMNTDLGIHDLLVLTGDSHSFWTNKLFNEHDVSMGIEIGTCGISSPGDFLSFGHDIAEEMDKRLAEHNREVVWTNGRENGYVKLTLEKEKSVAEYKTVSTVISENYQSATLKKVVIKKENGNLLIS